MKAPTRKQLAAMLMKITDFDLPSCGSNKSCSRYLSRQPKSLEDPMNIHKNPFHRKPYEDQKMTATLRACTCFYYVHVQQVTAQLVYA